MKKTILSSSGLPKHVQVQRSSLVNDDTAFIEAIPAIVFAVVISYVYLNVGTYMNGILGSELVDSYPGNTKTGLVNTDTWYNIRYENVEIIGNIYETPEKLED